MSGPRPKRPAWTRRLLACRFDLRQGRTGVGRCTPDRGVRHPLIRPAVPACSRGAGVAADAALPAGAREDRGRWGGGGGTHPRQDGGKGTQPPYRPRTAVAGGACEAGEDYLLNATTG